MAELVPTETLNGRFEIQRLLGRGGMGNIYLARDRTDGSPVAIKEIAASLLNTPGVRERFKNEVAACFKVQHENTVRAIDCFKNGGRENLVMEYVDGGDLSAKMLNGPLSIRESISILTQIAKGLEAIHKCGIVHRDLKPENILLSKSGVAKITDFGVAGLGGETTLTRAGSLVGTAKYIPPEFIETGECDLRGDIFAWGVIAYELVTGASPFKGTDINSLVMERFKATGREEIAVLAPKCPPRLAKAITKAMSVSLLQRYKSATDLLDDVIPLNNEFEATEKVKNVEPKVDPEMEESVSLVHISHMDAKSSFVYILAVAALITIVVFVYSEIHR